mgnify:CR=1 FL=1
MSENSGKKVAVVGSGPAGLAVAQQLTRAGHTVAVYERDDRPGGLLRYGIPEFKMEKAVLDRRIEQMTAEGTIFRNGVAVGADITGDELRDRYDAVVLATGATVRRDLPTAGRELGGVHQAMDYLPQANRVALGESVEGQVTAEGKDVVIIGGGDTGADCLGTAIRQQARSITQLEIMPRPADERPGHLDAHRDDEAGRHRCHSADRRLHEGKLAEGAVECADADDDGERHTGRAVDRVRVPREHGSGLPIRGGPRIRRCRTHGVGRPRQPGPRCGRATGAQVRSATDQLRARDALKVRD